MYRKYLTKVYPEKRGFTLIELLVSTAVIAVLAVVSATIFNSILRSQNKTSIVNEVRQNGNLVIDKFERDVKQAKSILPTGGPPHTAVTLTTSGGDVEWDCTAAGQLTRNSISIINTDAVRGVQVDSCTFTVTPSSPVNTQIVTFKFTLTQITSTGKSELEASVLFRVTVGTRSSRW